MSKVQPAMMDLYKEDEAVVHFGQINNPYDDFLSHEIVLPVLKGGSGRVLDLGCGAGRNAVEAAKMGYEVVAIELYEQPFRVAQKYIKAQGVQDKIKLYNRDFFKIRRGEFGAFDYCIVQEVLEHVEDYRKVVDIAYDSLKKQGMIVMTTRYNPKLWNIMDDYAHHVRRFTKPEILGAFDKFSYVSCFINGFPFYRFANFLYVTSLKLQKKKHNTATFYKNSFLKTIHTKIFPFFLRMDSFFNFTGLGNTIVVMAKK